MDRHGHNKARSGPRKFRSSSSSSSSSSDDGSFSLPSVRLLASKFSSLDKKGTAPKPPQPQAQPVPVSTIKKTTGGGQGVVSAPSPNSSSYSTNKPSYNSLPTKPTPQVVTNGRGPSYKDEDDDVFYNSSSTNHNTAASKSALRKSSSSSDSSAGGVLSSSWKRYRQQRAQKKFSSDSRDVLVSDRSSLSSVSADSPKHNVIFGVPLRRLDTISWGVKQKRVTSIERDSDSSSDDSRPATPTPSPAQLVSESKFSTFPKRVPPSVEDNSQKSSTLVKKGGVGVKSKVAHKLGDKSSQMYHSQSDVSSAAVAAGLSTWRRKSVSDDTYQLQHQPLARRQSISDLLKLYRTKSQSDLSQIVGDGLPSSPKSLQTQKEEAQAKAKAVSTPLKMSDLKIVNPMAKPKVEPYQSSTKDIVRLRPVQHTILTKSVSVPEYRAQAQVNNRQLLSSTSSTSDSESDRSKVVPPPPLQQRPKSVQYISRPQHFNRPQVLTKPSLVIVKPSKPTTTTTTTSAASKPVSTTSKPVIVVSNKPALSVKPAPPQKSSNAMKLTRMLTPPSYPGYSEPIFTQNPPASSRSSSSSSSSSSESEDEIPRKLQETIFAQKPDPVVHTNPVSAIISSLNRNTSQPMYPQKIVVVKKPQIPSWKSHDSADEADAIPHDDKMPSFIVPPQPKKNPIVSTKINVEKSITTNKTPWEPKSQEVRQNRIVSDDTDGIPHDDKVPSFMVTKPAQKVTSQTHRFEQKKDPPVKSFHISPLTKSWPPENKARSSSSSSDSTIKDLPDVSSPSKISVTVSQQNYKQPDPPLSTSSDSDSSDDETQNQALKVKTGFYEVNKEIIPSVENKKKVAIRITRKSSSSDSAEDEKKVANLINIESQIKEPRVLVVKQTRVPVLTQEEAKQRPKPSNLPKPAVTATVSPTKPILRGDSLTAVINIRAEPIKPSLRKASSSSDDLASPKATKIPTFKNFTRKESSTSDEDVKLTNVIKVSKPLESAKPSPQNASVTKESSTKKDTLDRNVGERSSSSSNSGGEQFEGFDPYAISRMIVRGSRKRDSHVKKPENLTNIMNATIPVHSPFSPLKAAANAKKAEEDAPIQEEKPTRRTSTASSSSSSSDDSLDFLNDVEQDGVFSANVVIVE